MSTVMVPANGNEALEMLETAAGFLADLDAAEMPAEALANWLRGLERADAVQAAARGRLLAAFDAKGGPAGDGQRTTRAWLVHSTRVTRGQAAEHKAVQALAEGHRPLLAGLREGWVLTRSVALQLSKWTAAIPGEFRGQAEEILVAAARAGAGLRELAANCAEMRRLLASDLLPQRAGQPVKALVHVSFADLCQLDADSALQDQWIAGYRARWAAHRAAVSVATGDGGAWLDGAAARAIVCDAMIIPVVTGDLDPGAVDQLITLCVQYDRLRHGQADADGTGGPGSPADPDPGPGGGDGLDGASVPQAAGGGTAAEVLALLEHQILATVLQVVSGPGGVASFLRRSLLGKGLGGPSLPLDVGQSDQIPAHLRRLVALRDQTCQYPGGCFL